MEAKRNSGLSCLRQFLRLAANTFIFLAVAVVTLALRAGVLQPVRRGFQCGDISLALPLKPETVSTNALLFGGLLVTIVTIAASNFCARNHTLVISDDTTLVPSKCSPPNWLRKSSREFFVFLLGLASTVMLTEMGKLSSGILRPNFLAMCRPDVDCSIEPPAKYQSAYECQASEEDELDARLSFPSGHATVVSYMGVFLMVYIHKGNTASGTCFLLRPFIQLAIFAVAYVTCLTRISDYVHHASDVVVGAMLGSALAVFTLRYLLKEQESEAGIMIMDNSSSTSMKISLRSCNPSEENASNEGKAAGVGTERRIEMVEKDGLRRP